MSREGRYNDLECLLLCMIVSGVTSGYAMKKEMRQMRTNRWSTESGSIYRALKRMNALGLIRESGKTGVPSRPRTEYQVTDMGKHSALEWLSASANRDEVQLIGDALREKCRFLGSLEADERSRVAHDWLAANARYAEELRADRKSTTGDSQPFEALAREGLVLAVEARHRWLQRLCDHLQDQA